MERNKERCGGPETSGNKLDRCVCFVSLDSTGTENTEDKFYKENMKLNNKYTVIILSI